MMFSKLKNWLYLVRWWLMPCAALCFLAALYGLGSSYQAFTTPRSSLGNFTKIHGDGWLENGAGMRFFNLYSRGNRVRLQFNPWRPAGVGDAILRVGLCGAPASEFTVSAQNPGAVIYLSAACEPRTLQFEVLNPFIGSETDQRQLGVQLISASVFSPLGVPLVEVSYILEAFAAALVLALLLSFAASLLLRSSTIVGVVLLAVPLISGLMLSYVQNLDLQKIFGLWLLIVFVCCGGIVTYFAGSASPSAKEESARLSRRMSRNELSAIFCIMLLGAGLRFFGLNFGLPNNFHPDEVPKVNAIMRMVESGTLDPNYFLHPSLLLYSTYAMNVLIRGIGFIPFEYLGIPDDFRTTAFFAGRIVSALAGTFSLLLVFLIGRRLSSSAAGLLGAAVLAVLPLHVTCSRYLKEDALLTFWVLWCVLLVLKAAQSDRKDILCWAGLVAGIASSTKYSGMLCGAILIAAPWIRSGSLCPAAGYFRATLLALGCMPIGFLICTPYAVLNSSAFIRDFSAEKRHMLRGHTIPIDPWSQYWMYHFWRSIIPGMSMPATLVGVLGVGVLAWRRRIEDLFLVALLLLFYLPAEYVKAKPEPQPERYIFPCLPFLALAAGEFMRTLITYGYTQRKVYARYAAAMVIFLVTITAPLNRTLLLAAEMRDDTREQLAAWMIANLPAGSKVYLDWKPYAPRFWNNEFEVTHIQRAQILQKLGADELRNSGYDYLVLSSLFYERYLTQPLAAPVLRERVRDVFEKVPIVRQFAPSQGTYGFHNPTLTLFSLKEEDFQRLAQERLMKEQGTLAATSNEMRAAFKWR